MEKSLAKDFELGAADRIPSVILSDVEHKALTKRLATTTRDAQTVEELWAADQKAYKDHPAWLAAIKRYFVK